MGLGYLFISINSFSGRKSRNYGEEMSNWKQFLKFLRGEAIDKYKGVLQERNAKALRIMGVIDVILAVSLLTLCRFSKMETFPGFYIFLLAMGLITYLMGKYMKKLMKFSTCIFYFIVEIYLIAGMYISIFLRQDSFSITFIVLLCTTLLVIVDKPFKVFAFILLNLAAFIVIDMKVKRGYVLEMDLYYATAFGIMATVLNLFTLQEHISSIEAIGRLEEYSKKVELKSRIDQLTGILNRGYGEESMRNHIESKDYGMFYIIDADKFKRINDTFGHAVGDKALETIADGLQKSFRKNDIITRMGGDEFAVFAPGITTDKEGDACIVRLRKYLSDNKLPEMMGESIRISVGQTLYNEENPLSFEELYTKTDAKMYLNKLSLRHGGIDNE